MSKHVKDKESDSVWFRTLLIIVIVVWVAIALGNLVGNYFSNSKFFNKKAEVVNTSVPGISTNTPSFEAPKDYGKGEEEIQCPTVVEEKTDINIKKEEIKQEEKINNKTQEENKEKPKEEVKKEKEIKKQETKKTETKTEQKSLYKLQAGFFADKDNAYKIANQIKSMGYSAYVTDVKSDGKSGYKVFVGSYKSKENAEKSKEELKAKGVDVMIIEQ